MANQGDKTALTESNRDQQQQDHTPLGQVPQQFMMTMSHMPFFPLQDQNGQQTHLRAPHFFQPTPHHQQQASNHPQHLIQQQHINSYPSLPGQGAFFLQRQPTGSERSNFVLQPPLAHSSFPFQSSQNVLATSYQVLHPVQQQTNLPFHQMQLSQQPFWSSASIPAVRLFCPMPTTNQPIQNEQQMVLQKERMEVPGALQTSSMVQGEPQSTVVMHKHPDGASEVQKRKSDDKDDSEPPLFKFRKRRRRSEDAAHSSSYRGVSWHKRDARWVARAWVNGRVFHLGNYRSEERAAVAVDEKHLECFGPKVNLPLNFPNSEDRDRIKRGLLPESFQEKQKIEKPSLDQELSEERNQQPNTDNLLHQEQLDDGNPKLEPDEPPTDESTKQEQFNKQPDESPTDESTKQEQFNKQPDESPTDESTKQEQFNKQPDESPTDESTKQEQLIERNLSPQPDASLTDGSIKQIEESSKTDTSSTDHRETDSSSDLTTTATMAAKSESC